MSDQAVEILITNAIHSAFIKYPEGDGGPNLDYEWIAPDQSAHRQGNSPGAFSQRISDCEKGSLKAALMHRGSV